MADDKRLIEKFLPIKAISDEASREKYIREGHISTMHLWWCRGRWWHAVRWNLAHWPRPHGLRANPKQRPSKTANGCWKRPVMEKTDRAPRLGFEF